MFSTLAWFLALTAGIILPRSPETREEQQSIPMVHATAGDIAQLHAEHHKFLCVDLHLYIVVNNKIFGLIDSFGEQIVCKVT